MKAMKFCLILFYFGIYFFQIEPIYSQNNFERSLAKTSDASYDIATSNNMVTIKNHNNRLSKEKPNYDIESLSLKGIDIVSVEKQVKLAVKNYITDNQLFRIKNQSNIALTLLIQNDGRISEVIFHIPSNSILNINDINKIEKLIKNIPVNIRDKSMYSNVNYIPITMTIKNFNLL